MTLLAPDQIKLLNVGELKLISISLWGCILLSITEYFPCDNPEHKIVGTVYDAKTFRPISFVNIFTSTTGTYTNINGHFSLTIKLTDTLHFSHVNYFRYDLPAAQLGQDSAIIFLVEKEIILNEITISGLPSEEIFKGKILETKNQETKEETYAKTNFFNAQKLFRAGYTPSMNSEDNYKIYMEGSKGVSILSSDPSKGLIKALRNISQYNSIINSYQTSPQPIKLDSTWVNSERILKKDSLANGVNLEYQGF